jgi:hypothetical protein
MGILGELQQLGRRQLVQLAALGALFSAVLALSLRTKGYVLDPDIWWHLRVGDWILQHRAVPKVGIFSRTASARPWMAYSWVFEVVLSRIYSWFGLLGFACFGIVLSMLVSVTLFGTCYALSRSFWRSWLLTLLGSYCYVYSLYPRPVFLSMVLFNLMLCMILKAQRTGRLQILFWFPLLFLAWANVHIQFIYGLATFALYIAINAALRFLSRVRLEMSAFRAPSLPLLGLSVIFAASLAASCIGPYSYKLFVVVFQYSKATQTYSVIQELQAPPFNSLAMFAFLFVIMAAFYSVGWRKKLDAYQLSLLLVASLCAFRTVRDLWFAASSAIMVLADCPAETSDQDAVFSPTSTLALTGAMAVLAFLLSANLGFNTRGIDHSISQEYPVDAANYLRRLHPEGPLYNEYDWGGFLIWYLSDYPVVIDGRNDLYGDAYVAHHIQFSAGDRTDGNPQLDESGIVLLSKDAPLAKLLKFDSRFRLVYEDHLADVFLRNYGPGQETE